MAVIKTQDLIDSVADALQYISYYHPKDFVDAMYEAYNREESKPAKDAMAQILINSRMSAYGQRPICQDTGMVCAFVKVGMDAKLDDTSRTITELVNEGVKKVTLMSIILLEHLWYSHHMVQEKIQKIILLL